jgi:hypothetical protein
MRLLIVLALSLFLAPSSYAQEPAPELTMHRLQAGSPDSGGWTIAESTAGAFSARMPCKFNDFSVEGSDEHRVVRILHSLGCLRPDQKKFTATRFVYGSEKDAQIYFDKFMAQSQWPLARTSRAFFGNRPAINLRMEAAKQCVFLRAVRVGTDNILLVATVPESSCSTLEAMSTQFFDSLSIGVR